MTHERMHELAAADALAALDDDERRELHEHLAGCPECRAEAESLRETAGALAFVAATAEPPPELRDRLLASARTETPNVVPLRPRRRWTTRVAAVAAAAAAAALAIGLWQGVDWGGGSGRTLALTRLPSGAAQVAVDGLPDAPAGKAYQLWVIGGSGTPQPAGLFTQGSTAVVVRRPVAKGDVVAVTLEPARGSRAPTTPILVQTAA
jgi:anti-sigma-K factor RskA